MTEKPSVFTPSNTSAELLEKMFVQRHKLLDKSVKWTEQSILTDKKNHLIYIGSRGSGKTHFITMLINRIKRSKDLEDKMVIVWLGEDATITSYLDLVLSILQQMVVDYPQQFNADCLSDIQTLSADDKAKTIITSINQQLVDKTIVLVKENINQVFRGLKDVGQKSLRAHLQEHNNMVLVCTSQLLFKGITSRDAVFFGFFDTYHLKPLNLKQATQLVINIAKHQGNKALIDFINTPQGCYRMRALHYLAGGNHRLYIELVDFLVAESLDNLVKAINDLIEVLTPYFQERINSLPDQQQKIVQQLCKIQGAIPVKQLAEQMIIIEQRTLAKQLGELKAMNYVVSHKRGKQSFYEISEPLMRLSEEIKNSHGKPLKLLVNLIRAWFYDDELHANSTKETGGLLSKYKLAALKSNSDIRETINKQIINEANEEYFTKNYETAISKFSELITSPVKIKGKAEALIRRGFLYIQQEEIDKAIKDYSHLIKLDGAPIGLVAEALLNRGATYGQQGDFDKAIKDFSRLIKLDGAPIEEVAKALFNRGVTYGQQGDLDKAIKDFSHLIKLNGAPIEEVAKALFIRSLTYRQQGDIDKAIKDFNDLIKLDGAPIELVAQALLNRGITYGQQGDIDKAINDFTKIINNANIQDGYKNNANFNMVELYYQQLNLKKAHAVLTKTLKDGNKSQDNYPSNITDILIAIIKLGSSHWQKEVNWIVKVFNKHKLLEFIGAGLIKATVAFIDDKSLESSLEKWQQLWQKQASDYDQMEIPLTALKASRLAIEQKSDKPLFALNKETRQLVIEIIEEGIK